MKENEKIDPVTNKPICKHYIYQDGTVSVDTIKSYFAYYTDDVHGPYVTTLVTQKRRYIYLDSEGKLFATINCPKLYTPVPTLRDTSPTQVANGKNPERYLVTDELFDQSNAGKVFNAVKEEIRRLSNRNGASDKVELVFGTSQPQLDERTVSCGYYIYQDGTVPLVTIQKFFSSYGAYCNDRKFDEYLLEKGAYLYVDDVNDLLTSRTRPSNRLHAPMIVNREPQQTVNPYTITPEILGLALRMQGITLNEHILSTIVAMYKMLNAKGAQTTLSDMTEFKENYELVDNLKFK